MLDPAYQDFLLEHHQVLAELETRSWDENDGRLMRSVRYRPKPVIEKIGNKKVPAEWFAFIEESTYVRAGHTLRFQNIPTSDRIKKMVINEGEVTLRSSGDKITERVTAGELRLVLPFLLKPLAGIGERVIHSEAVKLLDEEARVMELWLARRSSVNAAS